MISSLHSLARYARACSHSPRIRAGARAGVGATAVPAVARRRGRAAPCQRRRRTSAVAIAIAGLVVRATALAIAIPGSFAAAVRASPVSLLVRRRGVAARSAGAAEVRAASASGGVALRRSKRRSRARSPSVAPVIAEVLSSLGRASAPPVAAGSISRFSSWSSSTPKGVHALGRRSTGAAAKSASVMSDEKY